MGVMSWNQRKTKPAPDATPMEALSNAIHSAAQSLASKSKDSITHYSIDCLPFTRRVDNGDAVMKLVYVWHQGPGLGKVRI